MGVCILFSFRVVSTTYVLVDQDGHARTKLIYQVVLDRQNLFLYYFTIFFIVVSNKIFLVILIVVNILLYIELKKIMKKKLLLMNR